MTPGVATEKFLAQLGTLHELFAFNDWARDAVMGSALGLSGEQLDSPFEMGEGSLRKTLNHLYAAESVWLDRWLKRPPHYRTSAEGVEMASLWAEFRALAERRNDYLGSVNDSDLRANLTYTNIKGQTLTFPLGAMMLHVCNHGSHHRAQAVNMLRRVGATLPKPGADYIFMKLEKPEGTRCALDADTIRAYFRYTDWAQGRLLAAAAPLSDDQLDRKFDIGAGSLRAILVHLRDAEAWWLTNWTKGPGEFFPAARVGESLSSIAASSDKTRQSRNQLLETLTDDALARRVDVTPRQGVHRNFPIGVTMIQICHHGTHHRAQAVNILRHVGGSIPAMDVLEMLK